MKNLVYALVGAGFMIACQPSDQPEISGMLTGIESDTLLVQSFPVNDRDSRDRYDCHAKWKFCF